MLYIATKLTFRLFHPVPAPWNLRSCKHWSQQLEHRRTVPNGGGYTPPCEGQCTRVSRKTFRHSRCCVMRMLHRMAVTCPLDELYDRHAPVLYGSVLRLAGEECAGVVFQDACKELWDTPKKRGSPCTVSHMACVAVSISRKHAKASDTTPAFEARLTVFVKAMRTPELNQQALSAPKNGSGSVAERLPTRLASTLPA